MKILRYIAATVAFGALLPSCSLLDIAPDGRETLKGIFSDYIKTESFLNSCYENIPKKAADYYWVCNAPTALSDEGWLTYGTLADAIPAKLYSGGASASNHPMSNYDQSNGLISYYSTYMYQLRRCAIFLANIDNAAVLSEQKRAAMRAEAHVLRAYFMTELLKWYGAYAFSTTVYPDDFDYTTLRKPTVWQIAEQIDADCTAAINTPELPWRYDQELERMRMTKSIAWCLKSKAYLFAASPLHSEDYSDAEKEQHWAKAYEVCSQALDELEKQGFALKTTVSNASLYKGPAAAYQELFTSSTLTTVSDPETIWQAREPMNLMAHNFMASKTWELGSSSRAGVVPTQEMVDAYEVTDADRTVAEPLLDLSQPYDAAKNPNYNQKALDLGYDKDDPYAAHRDPRMDVCIIRNGSLVSWGGKMHEAETFVGGASGISDDPKENTYTRTGYYYRKYVAPNADPINGIGAAPWKYFRLAEIKLNLAEAAAEAGHLDVAKDQVDDIRRRVGMPELPSGLSKEEMILRVRQERMVELCYEECRYFDIRRWAEAFNSSAGFKDFNLRCRTLTGMWITRDKDTGDLTYERKPNLMNMSTNPRDLLLPIPENEAQMLYSLTNRKWQNSGW